MHVNMLAQWCPTVSKTHRTEAKSLGLKSSRTAANPAMEGAHTLSAESITIPRKIKITQKRKREKEGTSTPQKLKNIKATLKPKHTFRFLLHFYYPISFSVPCGTLLVLPLRLHWDRVNSENEAKSFQMSKHKEAKLNATLTCGDANNHCSSGRLRSWWKPPGRHSAKNAWKTKESTFPLKCLRPRS